MATPNVQIYGGGFQSISGGPLANGYLIASLSHDAQFASGPDQITAGTKIKISLDNTGNIPTSPAVYLYSTDVLNPSGTYYLVQAYEADGTTASTSPQIWQFDATPDPLNVGSIVPLSPPGPSLTSPVVIVTGSSAGANYALLPISSIVKVGTNVQGPTYPLAPFELSTAPTATTPALSVLPSFLSGPIGTATAWSIASNVLTVTVANSWTTSQDVFFSGFTTGAFLNGTGALLTNATSTTTTSSFTHANTSATESGTVFPIDTGFGVTNCTAWSVASNVLTLTGPNYPIGATAVMELFSTGTFLNGQTFQVTFSAAGNLTASVTHADDSATEVGYLFLNGVGKLVISGWAISSNVLTIYTANSNVPSVGLTFTVGGLSHGSYLNGQSFTVSTSSNRSISRGAFVHADASATESGKSAVLNTFSSVLASTATIPFTLGLLKTYSVVGELQSVSNGRFYIGLADSAYLTSFAFNQSGAYSHYNGTVMANDTLPFSFVGFRYSPTNAGDSKWQCICNNAGTQTVVNSNIAADTSAHIFGIVPSGGSVAFTIDNVTVATINTNVPSTSVPLVDALWADNSGAVTNFCILLAAGLFWQLTP